MSSMWCCYSQRPVSPLPNNRPVDLPRPAGTRTPVFRRLTIRKASQGSETRDASKDSGNLRATRQAFETSVSIDTTPIETSQTPNLIDVPQPSGRWSRIFTRFTTHNASKDSEVFQAKAKPIKASQIASSVDIPRPVGRHSRIFTRLTTRKTSKDSEDMQADASPVETSQNTNLVVDVPHPIERRSRIFTHLTGRKTSRGSEDLQAEASPVKSFQNTKLVDVPHSIERRSRLFTLLSTRNTFKGSKNLHTDATPDQTYQNTNQADTPHPTDRRSLIFTRLSTRNTSKDSEDLHTDATPEEETYQNTKLVDVPHSIERRSRLFTRLTTRNASKGSEDSHTDATPDETYQNTNLVDAPHPADRRSRIFTRLTTQSTSKSGDYTPAEAMPVVTSQNQTKSTVDEDIAPKGGDHTQAEAIPVETSENQTSSTIDEDNVELDMFHLTETQSYTSGHLPTHDTFEGSEDTQATRHISGPTLIIEATPPSLHLYDMRISHSLRSRSLLSSSSLPNLASPYGNHASALASTLSLPSLPSPPASPPPPAASPPPAAPPSPPAPAAPAPHTPPTSSIYSSTESVGVAPMTLSSDLPPPRRSLDSVWARYPSHDRQGRSLSPAGGREGVAVRDFAPVVVGSPATAVKKARSMGDLLRGCVRRHERQMAKPPGGHRSSIAPGGFVEYPELELVAPATPFAPAAAAAAPAAPPAAEEEDLSVSPSAPAPQPDLRAPSSEGLAAQFADCVEEDPSEDGEADLARGLHFAELVALRREVNAILAEEMALGLYEGDFY